MYISLISTMEWDRYICIIERGIKREIEVKKFRRQWTVLHMFRSAANMFAPQSSSVGVRRLLNVRPTIKFYTKIKSS